MLKHYLNFLYSVVKVSIIFGDYSLIFFNPHRKINKIRREIKGRVCGSYEDQLMQIAASRYIDKNFKNDNIGHLEIGTLFGGSTILRLYNNRNSSNIVTKIIDPLNGFYGENVDVVTKLPVNKSNLLNNFKKFKLNIGKIKVIDKESQDPSCLNKVSKDKFHLLMIDGDHSYEGIKNDWENYSKLVIVGGIVIIDDYNEKHWKDISRYVNSTIKKDSSWIVLGCLDTTLVMKRVK